MIVYPDGVLGEQEASFEQTRTGGIDINRTNMAPLARIAPTWLPSPVLSAKGMFSVCLSSSVPPIISTGF